MSASLRSNLSLVATIVLLVLAAAACGGSDESTATTTSPSNESVSVQITAPTDGSSHRADRVTVRGTVEPPDAAVQILGQPAQVGNGVFTGSVALHSGENTIDVVASSESAAPASRTITVTRRRSASSESRWRPNGNRQRRPVCSRDELRRRADRRRENLLSVCRERPG